MDEHVERAAEPEIATTTLAEIYRQQGLFERALVIYRRVAERSPDDARLASRIAELQREIERQRAAQDTPREAPRDAREEGPDPVVVEEAAPAPAARRAPPVDEDAAFSAWLAGKQ